MTLGTRGDVQPYVALSQELIKNGHSAVICTGESFKGFIEEHGVCFRKAESDLMALLMTKEGKEIMEGGLKNFRAAIKYSKEVINPLFRKSLDDFWESAQGADIIIYHPKVLAAVDMAHALGIICISMPLVPITYPITEFPNIAVSSTWNFGKIFNKLTYKIIEMADISNIKEINDFREKTLGLGKRKSGVFAYKNGDTYIPIIYPVSPALFKDVKSWNDRVFLPGFFYLDTKEEMLDEEVEKFIEKGKKPIVVSFSSMPLKQPEIFKKKLIEALYKTDNRAVILVGTSGMDFKNDDNVLSIKKAPHNLLFKKAMGIIHHGGVGTMAEALRSGVPQIIIPFSVDQPFWANRLYKLGYALKPLYEKTLATSDLISAFKEMQSEKYVKSAKEIKDIVLKENGVKEAVAYIEHIYAR